MFTAEQLLAQTLVRRAVRQRLLKSTDAWQTLYSALQEALSRAWETHLRLGITAGIDYLRDLDPGTFTEADAEMLLNALENHVGAEAMSAVLYVPVLKLTEALYRSGLTEAGRTIGVDINFSAADVAALNIVQRANLYWIGNIWSNHTNKLLRDALTDYFQKGYTRTQMMERLADDFADFVQRGSRYWELLADHIATRTREMGRVSAYQSAHVNYVQVRAHLDSRTTQICRKMHGKIIPVARLVAQRDEYLDAVKHRDMDKAKKVWRMWQDNKANELSGQDLPNNTALPPYHYRCRTITVAYFD